MGWVQAKTHPQETLILLCSRIDALASGAASENEPSARAFTSFVTTYSGKSNLFDSVSVGDVSYELDYHLWLLPGMLEKAGRVRIYSQLNEPIFRLLVESEIALTLVEAQRLLKRIQTILRKHFRVAPNQSKKKKPLASTIKIKQVVADGFKGNRSGVSAHELITSAGNASLPVAALTAGGASLPRLIGTVAGSTLGRTAARGIGEGLGLTPDQQDLAGDIGTIAGGYGGSRLADVDTAPMRNLAASKLRAPYTGNLKPWVPRIPFAKWATEAVVPRGEEGSITNPLVVPREQIETVAPGKYYRTTNVHIAQPPAEGLPAKLSTAPKSNLPGTIIAPEPRAPFPGEDEGYMSSIPRGRLPGLAASGKPGAATQLQNLGKTVLYTPPEGYPGPRVSQPLSPEEIDEALRPLYRNAAD